MASPKRRRRTARPAAGTGAPAAERTPAPTPGQASRASARPWWAGPVPLVGVAAALLLAGGTAWLLSRPAGPSPAPAPATTGAADRAITLATGTDLSRTAALGAAGVTDPLKPAGTSVLRAPDGRLRVIYVGAEFCPYCAAQRWALVVALGRFGTWSGLELTRSSSTDAYPDTPTFTFQRAALHSTTVAFESVEIADRAGNHLRDPSAEQQALMQKADPQGSIPFVDVGGRWVTVGGSYLPSNMAALDWEQVAAQVAAGSDPLARQVLGTANWYTAAICRAGGDSAPPCSDSGIRALEDRLGG